MKELPILFSAPMVRAILAGTKTQTRRVVKPQPKVAQLLTHSGWSAWHDEKGQPLRCPYGQPGDRLWVRETWRHTCDSLEEARALTDDITSGTAVDYRATYVDELMRNGPMARADAEECCRWETWKPSIHMPRWASRITIEITDVRVQRLQEISAEDAVAEGVDPAPGIRGEDDLMVCEVMSAHFPLDGEPRSMMQAPTARFVLLWDSINGKQPGVTNWNANPWVWALTFRRWPSTSGCRPGR